MAVPSSNSNSTSSAGQGNEIPITPELIKKIAAKVYALMQADAKIENERRRHSPQPARRKLGVRHVF